jgi:hypothetical protein
MYRAATLANKFAPTEDCLYEHLWDRIHSGSEQHGLSEAPRRDIRE